MSYAIWLTVQTAEKSIKKFELYTRNLGEREMPENYILSEGAGGTDYLCSETYIHSGKEIRGSNMEGKGKQMRIELYI